MPRDLEAIAREDALNSMSQLTQSPDNIQDRQGPMSAAEDAAEEAEDEMPQGTTFSQLAQRNEKRDELHPYTQTLSPSDVESCLRLEEEAFPPNERATREKFQYRLKQCGTLSMGIFTSHNPTTTTNAEPIPTASTATPVYSGTPNRKAVLLGHIIATMTTNSTVTDGDMAIPDPDSASTSNQPVGHQEIGRTLCIHSLAVLPQYHRRGLGSTIVKAYLQRMETQGVADRVALIAHEALIPYYEKFGFRNLGKSKAEFAGGGWFDMVRDLKNEDVDGEEEVEFEVEEDVYVEEVDEDEEDSSVQEADREPATARRPA